MTGTTFIVLFRGVGGATQLPVAALRAALSAAGFTRAETYINSGNAVVAGKSARETLDTIAEIARTGFGFGKDILLATPEEWRDAIDACPYAAPAEAEPASVHLYTMQCAPAPSALEALAARADGSERFESRGRFLYLHAPDGVGRSKFVPKIETTLKVAMTARNWNTVTKLADLAGAA